MGHLRRTVMLATSALLGAVAAISAAAPAQAAPIPITFHNVTGTTHLAKPNVDVAVPSSVVQTQLDLETNTVTGSGPPARPPPRRAQGPPNRGAPFSTFYREIRTKLFDHRRGGRQRRGSTARHR